MMMMVVVIYLLESSVGIVGELRG